MAILVLWALALLAAALPGLMPDALGFRAYPPDLWIVVVVYIALQARGYAAVGWGILLGVLRDAASLDPLGTHAFVLGTIGWMFCEGSGHRGRVTGAPRVLLTALAAAVATWIHALRGLPMGYGLGAADLYAALPSAFTTGCLAAVVGPVLDHFALLEELMGRRRGLPA